MAVHPTAVLSAALFLGLSVGCDALTHSGSHEHGKTASPEAATPVPTRSARTVPVRSEPTAPPKASPSKASPSEAGAISREQFFAQFEGKTLQLDLKDEERDLKGCLAASWDVGKCRWHLKGTLKGTPVEFDATGHCLFDPTGEPGQYQLDIVVSHVTLLESPSGARIVDKPMNSSDPELASMRFTNVYAGEIVSPLPKSPEALLSGPSSDATLRWVQACRH